MFSQGRPRAETYSSPISSRRSLPLPLPFVFQKKAKEEEEEEEDEDEEEKLTIRRGRERRGRNPPLPPSPTTTPLLPLLPLLPLHPPPLPPRPSPLSLPTPPSPPPSPLPNTQPFFSSKKRSLLTLRVTTLAPCHFWRNLWDVDFFFAAFVLGCMYDCGFFVPYDPAKVWLCWCCCYGGGSVCL